MKIDINMIKGLLIALAASFLFACAAEAQQGKQTKHLGKLLDVPVSINQA
ncbi:hypothetical protein [Mucilaginibacter lappiensis]|nr:hypothetical protein [Mucilaginibacter lappiensis]MBB6131587.1 outer membrane biogenesis lipoprotein LolB [Mucilaginibacter lappiensis]SIQ36131.1 hypothetical protein SAMN05421821_102277 [Mucilaginibacter lappiensis]